MLKKILSLIGLAEEEIVAGLTVGWNASGELKDWVLYINRIMIKRFAGRRFAECYRLLDGGDKRLMTSFLEPDCITNTRSLLGGPHKRGAGEFTIDARGRWAWLKDAFGPQALNDNSSIIVDEHATDGPERWFFLNGIATSYELAQINAADLREVFGRSFITIHNPTQGIVYDLVESALQKFTNVNTDPVARAFIAITDAILDPAVDKVVVIAHSQGTIIMGDVLDLIYVSLNPDYYNRTNMNGKDFADFLAYHGGVISMDEIVKRVEQLRRDENGAEKCVRQKLEMYLFANGASRMCYLDREKFLPHIESYANERDIVARLGSLAQDQFHREGIIRIDGPVFTSKRFGHLLSAHYLHGFLAGEYALLEDALGTCVGRSVNDDIAGNPGGKNPERVAGPSVSKLATYVGQPEAREVENDARKGNGKRSAPRSKPL